MYINNIQRKGGLKLYKKYLDTGKNRFLPKFVKNTGFIWKMFGTIVENRFSRKSITNQTFSRVWKNERFGIYLGNIWNHCLEIFWNSLVSSCLQLWNLFGNIITEIWNLIGVFMEIFRMVFGIFFVMKGRLMDFLWNNHGSAFQVARVVICKN